MQYTIKIVISAILVVAISELSKRSSLLGALLASLPIVSIMAMIWLHVDTGDDVRVAVLAMQIFWLVLPSLVLFIALPALLNKGLAFYPSLGIAAALTAIAYLLLVSLLKHIGVQI